MGRPKKIKDPKERLIYDFENEFRKRWSKRMKFVSGYGGFVDAPKYTPITINFIFTKSELKILRRIVDHLQYVDCYLVRSDEGYKIWRNKNEVMDG